MFVKSTDRHQFSHYTSSHPENTRRSIVLGQALKVRRVCSYESDFNRHFGNMKSWLLERGYPSDLAESEMKKVNFTPNVNNRERGKFTKGSHVSWLITLNLSHWTSFSLKMCTFYIWRKKWTRFLHQNPWFYSAVPEAKQLFSES